MKRVLRAQTRNGFGASEVNGIRGSPIAKSTKEGELLGSMQNALGRGYSVEDVREMDIRGSADK